MIVHEANGFFMFDGVVKVKVAQHEPQGRNEPPLTTFPIDVMHPWRVWLRLDDIDEEMLKKALEKK